MKNLKIFLLLILSIKISSLELFKVDPPEKLEENNITKFEAEKDTNIKLNLPEENNDFYITILSLKKGVKITINNVGVFNKSTSAEQKENVVTKAIKLTEQINQVDRYIEFSVSEKCEVEVSSVLKNGNREYQNIEYKIDTEISVQKNNFVIFLKDEDVEKFEMKFNFKEDIKNKEATYGFLFLPTESPEYIVLGKHYRSYKGDNSLETIKFDEAAKQLTAKNDYYEKGKETNKEHLAFIFSIDYDEKTIQEFSFTINSEIINVFLIVSIVIALVFAVITFFLIRRKQTTEGTNVEGGENLYKKNEKEEKDEKEEATEN